MAILQLLKTVPIHVASAKRANGGHQYTVEASTVELEENEVFEELREATINEAPIDDALVIDAHGNKWRLVRVKE
jgi:hypothetical protein